MKVGILSMQRIKNYGSFLQAYGLKKTIESLGHNVEFVDYKYEKTVIVERKKSLYKKILNNINIFKYIKKKKIISEYNRRFNEEFIPTLCDKDNIHPHNIDCLVIGSDEVFNCLQGYPVGYSKDLFGNGYDNVISYAASFGQTTYNDLKKYNIDKEIGNMLGKFKAISVRDENSYNNILKLTSKKPELNLDPVLITDYTQEMIDNVNIKDYIILYAYPGRITNDEKKAIKKFARRHNKKIVSFGMYQDIADIDITIHPFEIFAYFKHADFIITDTFHGSIFAIKTHSKFCTIIRNNKNGNTNKLEDLLKRLKLEDRILTRIEELEEKFSENIAYETTDSILEKERIKTTEYLKNNIRG